MVNIYICVRLEGSSHMDSSEWWILQKTFLIEPAFAFVICDPVCYSNN